MSAGLGLAAVLVLLVVVLPAAWRLGRRLAASPEFRRGFGHGLDERGHGGPIR